jgi:YesN/AraC family two-component response regulator
MESKTKHNASISVLFVEDDEIILEIQASILAARFPDVVLYTAANGISGLELFKAHMPDIVITDINMSVMCGEQMSKRIRELKPDAQFIAITGKETEELSFEFDHYIVKPVGFEKLFAAVEKCINGISNYDLRA